jgi:hypothetical protein
MKSVLVNFITSMVCVSAFAAGTGDVGSVGGTVPTSVKSTSDQIQQYSPQARALTIAQLCQTFGQSNLDWGKAGSKIKCIDAGNGIIELRGSNARGTLSVYANAEDKTVLEYFGDDEIHQYQNNLGQALRVEFVMVTTSVRNDRGAARIDGYFRVDALMGDKNTNSRLRVGYFSNL